jgi:alkanesulfonate monooxygenase SsuD/methylene tetrahydromethanopterin reductase-like flavin-dependent oxidoreductase (luciferase family)
MYVSLHLSPQSRGPQEDAEIIEATVRQAVEADAAGIASISLTEHHLAGFNTYCDPLLLGCYLAPQLAQAFVAAMVVQVPLQHPVRIAEAANLLDQLTKGRCMLAFASGSVRAIELDAFGVNVDERSGRARRGVDAILDAWGWRDDQTPVDVSSSSHRGAVAARISPSSYRSPHPLVGWATMTDATLLDCARRGWPAILPLAGEPDDAKLRAIELYRSALERYGHSAETTRECMAWLSPVAMISVAATESDAQRRLDRYMETSAVGPIVSHASEGTRAWTDEWRTRQRARAGIAYCGTPAMITDYLANLAETYDVGHVRVSFVDVPGELADSAEAHSLFLESVLPHLDPEPLPGPNPVITYSEPA